MLDRAGNPLGLHAPEISAFLKSGCAVLHGVLTHAECIGLTRCVDPLLVNGSRRPGVRRVIERAPAIIEMLRRSQVLSTVERAVGPGARVVRSILFDKTPERNWLVPWHQDPVIAVTARLDVPGFGPWSVKDGVPHCQPPVHVLESVAILRLHLDASPPESGPLRVLSGTSALGVLEQASIDRCVNECVNERRVVECTTDAGGAVLMRPLTVHSSARAQAGAGRRRVLHLEFSTQTLPGGLEWGEATDLRELGG